MDVAENKGFESLEIENPDREDFESYTESHNLPLIVLNGHGTKTAVEGDDGEIILEKGQNEETTEGSIVYSRTCSSAAELGPSCVEKGAKAYIGYEDKFNFVYQTSKSAKPLEDKVAELCLAPSNQVPISLIKGKTAGEAYNNSQRKYQEALRKALANYELDDGEIFKSVAWNMDVQTVVGDSKATLEE